MERFDRESSVFRVIKTVVFRFKGYTRDHVRWRRKRDEIRDVDDVAVEI